MAEAGLFSRPEETDLLTSSETGITTRWWWNVTCPVCLLSLFLRLWHRCDSKVAITWHHLAAPSGIFGLFLVPESFCFTYSKILHPVSSSVCPRLFSLLFSLWNKRWPSRKVCSTAQSARVSFQNRYYYGAFLDGWLLGHLVKVPRWYITAGSLTKYPVFQSA